MSPEKQKNRQKIYFKLILDLKFDLLRFIKLGSWFKISVPRKCAEFVSWVLTLQMEGVAMHPFLDDIELPFLWSVSESGVSGSSTFCKFT